MQTVTAKPRAGVHCELCGRPDPVTDDGYTSCCNEPTCWGGASNGDRIAYELDGRIVAVVVGACCGGVADAAAHAAGIDYDGGHADCSGCEVHSPRRRF
jgi:hypothetical protein